MVISILDNRLKYCLKGPLSPKQPINQHAGQAQKYPPQLCCARGKYFFNVIGKKIINHRSPGQTPALSVYPRVWMPLSALETDDIFYLSNTIEPITLQIVLSCACFQG